MTNIPPPPYETVPLGVDLVPYEQLTVGILRDEELEFVTIQKLWLPLKPRINEFRWALKSTFLGKSAWRVNLCRWCQFWFCFNTYEFWDPNSKKPLRLLHTDETLYDLLMEHMKAPRRVFFFVEELKTQQQWKPKVPYTENTYETKNSDNNISKTNFDQETDGEKMVTLSNSDHNGYSKCQQMSPRQLIPQYMVPCSFPIVVPIFIPVYTFHGNTEYLESAIDSENDKST